MRQIVGANGITIPRKPRGKPTLRRSDKDLHVEAHGPRASWRHLREAKPWKCRFPPATPPAGSFPGREAGDEAKLSGGTEPCSSPAPDVSHLTAEALGSGLGRRESPPGEVKTHLGDSRPQQGAERWDVLENIRPTRKFCQTFKKNASKRQHSTHRGC